MGYSKKVIYEQLVKCFSEDELKTLCHIYLDVDYDALGAKGKPGKIRELILLMEREGRLAALAEEIKEMRPGLAVDFEKDRAKKAREIISQSSDPQIQNAFKEYTKQVDAFFIKLTRSHRELSEWKELHNLLQGLVVQFSRCPGLGSELSRVDPVNKGALGSKLHEIENQWRECERVMGRIEQHVCSIEWTGEPYDVEEKTGPKSFLELNKISRDLHAVIFKLVREQPKKIAQLHIEVSRLREYWGNFDQELDKWFFLVDKELRKTVEKIAELYTGYLVMQSRQAF